MPRLFLCLTLVASASWLAVGHGQPASSSARSFRVMTLNIQAGTSSKGRYDLPRLADTIASIAPGMVGLQEVTRNHAEYHCDDQPKVLTERLRQITGKPWTSIYVKEWITAKRECVDSGRGDGVETEGLVLLAPEPILRIEHVELWNGRLGLAAQVASAPNLTVIVTHLASSAAHLDDRTRQIATLLPWAEQRGTPRILMGDFNSESTADELLPVRSQYRDAWVDATQGGVARGPASGSTRPNKDSRIDYVWYTASDRVRLDGVEVVDTSSFLAGEVSDHRPVVATFRLDAVAGSEPAPQTRR